MSARHRAMKAKLDLATLASELGKLIPRANQFGDVAYDELLNDLRAFRVNTRAQLRRVMLKHRLELRSIDRQPFDTLNAKIQRSELGEARFLDLQRRQIFFNSAGLVRLALELEHGEQFKDYVSKTYPEAAPPRRSNKSFERTREG